MSNLVYAVAPEPEETRWEARIQALKRHPAAEHLLYLGEHDLDGTPVILHRSALFAHSLIVGSTGSRKSSLAVGPTLSQLIRMRDLNPATGQWEPYAGLVCLDLKGDRALFHTLRMEAQRARRRFRWFTPLLGQATYPWNPLAHLDAALITLEQSGQSLHEALMDFAARSKAEAFFRLMNERKLMAGLRSPQIRNFQDLYRACSQFTSDHERETASEIVALLEGLASVQALNLSSPDAIDLQAAMNNKEVVYFWLPASREPQTVKLIARLVLFDLFQNASNDIPCFVSIDEFSRCASPTLTICLEQSRGLGAPLAFLLACQTLPDDRAFRQTIWTNTLLKIVHDVVDPDFADFLTRSLGNLTLRRAPSGVSLRVPLTAVEGFYGDLNTDPTLAIVNLTRDVGPVNLKGYPALLRMDYQMSEAEYHRRSHLPFPSDCQEYPGTLVVTKELPAHPTANKGKADPDTLRQFEENAKKLRERFQPRKREDL